MQDFVFELIQSVEADVPIQSSIRLLKSMKIWKNASLMI